MEVRESLLRMRVPETHVGMDGVPKAQQRGQGFQEMDETRESEGDSHNLDGCMGGGPSMIGMAGG